MMRKVLLALALGLAASCVHAQTAPSPADVGISKGTPDVFKLKGSDNVWTPFGSINPATHIFAPPTNGNIAPGDCIKWGPGLTSAGAACGSGGGGGGGGPLTIYTSHDGLANNVTTPTEAWTVTQQGFYAPGDGGDAVYQWNFGSYCPGGTSSVPAPADGISCVLPIGQSATTAGRYLLSVGGSLDVRQVGMQPGGQDNSPYVQALMTALSPPTGTTSSEIVFPGLLGQPVTAYYFSQPFVLSRSSNMDCKTPGFGYGSVALIFPAGINGVIQETGYLTDGGYGSGEIRGCEIASLGGGHAQAGSYTYILPGASVSNGGSGYTGTSGTMTWNVPGYCTTNPILQVSASGGVITAVTGIVNGGLCQSEIYNGPGWTAGGGLSGGSGASFSVVHTGVANVNNLTQVALDRASVVTGWGFPTPTCGAATGERQCNFGVGDGIVMLNPANPNSVNLAPGAYVAASNPGAGTLTLASPYTIGPLSGGSNTFVWDLPVSQKYTVQTTIGSNIAVVTAGPRLLRPGDQIWSDAFLFGTSVSGMNSAIVGTPTVNTGGSGFTGTSGTMVWTGPGCGGYGHAPVLNVTAASGHITSVTGVADAGNCEAATPSSSDTSWTASGGLSGGSGASFNTAWNQTVQMRTALLNQYWPANATVNHTSGSPGQMWVIPSGIQRRAWGRTRNNIVTGFGFGLDLICQGSTDPPLGCNASYDEGNSFTYNMVGRMVRGNNAGVSTSLSNIYAQQSIADEIEGGSIGSTYISEENNSVEDATAPYDTLILCATQNFSVFMGSYLSGQGPESCIGTDAQGYPNIGVPASIGDSALFLAPIYGSPGAPTIGIGGFSGHWGFSGPDVTKMTATVATAAGSTVVTIPTLQTFATGMQVYDLTNTDAIPFGTSVTVLKRGSVTLSNPVAGGGVQVGDVIQFWQNGPTVNIWMGQELNFPGMRFSGGGSDVAIVANGYDNALDFNNDMRLTTKYFYRGYSGDGDSKVVFPLGLELSNNEGNGYLGQERLFDAGSVAPGEAWHLQGDTRFNTGQGPGGNLAWTSVPAFTTTASADFALGVTAVTVAGCPSPALPVGTPIIDYEGIQSGPDGISLSQPIGTLASCSGTTLTLQAAATNGGSSGNHLQFIQWRQAAQIANDAAGTSWPVANVTDIADLAACGATTVGFGVVNNGVAVGTGGYGSAVSATGAVTRPVFCDGTSWTYH